MNNELRATICSHIELLNGRTIELVLVPDDVSAVNADKYLQFAKAYKQVPLILVQRTDAGGYKPIYSDLSLAETKAVFSLSLQSLAFCREHYFYSDSSADKMPTWPSATT